MPNLATLSAGKLAEMSGVQIGPGATAFTLIPLPASAVRQIVDRVEPYPFDRIYGAWWDRVVATDGKVAVAGSAERYIAAIQE